MPLQDLDHRFLRYSLLHKAHLKIRSIWTLIQHCLGLVLGWGWSRRVPMNWKPVYHTIPYYTILYYTILYYTILYSTLLCYTILYFTILSIGEPRASGPPLAWGSIWPSGCATATKPGGRASPGANLGRSWHRPWLSGSCKL